MTEQSANKTGALPAPWNEPIYGAQPSRPSAPRPAVVLQGFSAVPLPVAQPQVEEKKAASKLLWILAATVLGLALIGTGVGFAVKAALRNEPSDAPARVRRTPVAPPAAVQPAPAPSKAVRTSAPAKSGRSRAKVAAKPAKQTVNKAPPTASAQVAPQPKAQRSAKYAEEPSDPD